MNVAVEFEKWMNSSMPISDFAYRLNVDSRTLLVRFQEYATRTGRLEELTRHAEKMRHLARHGRSALPEDKAMGLAREYNRYIRSVVGASRCAHRSRPGAC